MESKQMVEFSKEQVPIEKSETGYTKHAFETERQWPNSVVFGLPVSPSGVHISQFKKILSTGRAETPKTERKFERLSCSSVNEKQLQKQEDYNSAEGEGHNSSETNKTAQKTEHHHRDRRFDTFKTWSGKFERQLSNLRGIPVEPDLESGDSSENNEAEAVPVERYYAALEGPELDALRATEVPILPADEKWPFLLRFPISAFGICLGIGSQAMLWKTLATAKSVSFLHISPTVNLVLWCISVALTSIIASIYALKIVLYFEAVRREYYHPVRVNFFFAPWITCLFLVIGLPPSVAVKLHPVLWYVLMAPIFCLELKIYGQWMSGGQRRLSKMANPSNHLSIVGNFVGALLGASMGLKEGPMFFFAVGLAHYIVLFVTLYQRLPTNDTLPKELHPVFFLFVAAPSVASTAWANITGEFDHASKIVYFMALFLYISLAVRINFFRGFRFSLAWWAYTFPMTGAAVATIKYATAVPNVLTKTLSVGLSVIATCTVLWLLVLTVIHAFIRHDLFPNDVSIAITQKSPRPFRFLRTLKSEGSVMKQLEEYKTKKIDQF